MKPPLLSFLIGILSLGLASPALADDALNRHARSFRAHNNPVAMNRATTMWQVERLGEGGNASAGGGFGAVGGSSAVPSIGSVANMNIVTVIVGENGAADVAVEAEQQNSGDLDATGVTAFGGNVSISRSGG